MLPKNSQGGTGTIIHQTWLRQQVRVQKHKHPPSTGQEDQDKSPGIWIDILVHHSSSLGSSLGWPGMASFPEQAAACLEAILMSSLNLLQSDALDTKHRQSASIHSAGMSTRGKDRPSCVPHRGQVGFVRASRVLPSVALPTSRSLVRPLIRSGWLFGTRPQALSFTFLGVMMLF